MNATLKAITKGDNIFYTVDLFFKQQSLERENPSGGTTDGASSMLSQKPSFRACVVKVAPHVA